MIEREVVWTGTAQIDLDHIASFIANDDIANAFVFIVSVLDARRDLAGLLLERLVR